MAMDAPATIKDAQKLIGCMAALNRFLSRLGERGLPFFNLLKQQDKFEWTIEAAEALENLKHHLQSPPTLTAPLPGKELLLYIAVTTHVVSVGVYYQACTGISLAVRFVSRDRWLWNSMVQGTQRFRQVRAASCVIPYVLCGGLYCLRC